MTDTGTMLPLRERRYALAPRTRLGLALAAAAGAACFVVGLFVAPERAWGGYLMGLAFFTSLALAGPLFLALLALSGARWAVALQRIPEAMSAALPAAAVLGLGLLLGTHSLYEWSHAGVVRLDELLQHKSSWLNPTGFAVRLVIAFAIWIACSRRLLTLGRRVEAGEPGAIASRVRTAALFLALFAVTFSLASFDWLMSLEPHWFSTMFALLQLAGLCCVGVASAVLLALAMERQGALRGILNEEHLHDLGKLLFALTLFWAYCWFCQYMLIWYTDIPEETAPYLLRQEGSWWLLVRVTLLLQWGVPFLALLSRRGCRSRAVLGRVAAVVLVGHALELFVQVGPPLLGGTVAVGAWELGPLAGAVALWFLVVLRALGRTDAVPVHDPHLHDSLSYQTP